MASSLVKVGLIGGAAFVAYESGFLDWALPVMYQSKPTGSQNVTPGAVPKTPTPNAIQGANTIDGVYAKMVSAAPSGSHSIDEWDVWLTSAMQGAKPGFVAPDPMPLFVASVPGFDRSQQLTAGQYWAVLAPWLKQNAGLSGLGPRGLGWMAEMRRT